jgi:hypothetical protein
LFDCSKILPAIRPKTNKKRAANKPIDPIGNPDIPFVFILHSLHDRCSLPSRSASSVGIVSARKAGWKTSRFIGKIQSRKLFIEILKFINMIVLFCLYHGEHWRKETVNWPTQ